MEIDAPGEFASLKKQYQRELENFLQNTFENFDIPFDRQVMERMLDLSPPGLDEIMALMRVMDFLDQGRYDLFILDSAPTGHLLRLLELPELIGQWLKTFFGLLLKYKLTFRFPDLSQQLVRISRDLKLLPQPVAQSGPGRALRRLYPDGNGLPGDRRSAGLVPAPGDVGAGAFSQPGHPGPGLSPVRRPESPGGAHPEKFRRTFAGQSNRYLSPERTPGSVNAWVKLGAGPCFGPGLWRITMGLLLICPHCQLSYRWSAGPVWVAAPTGDLPATECRYFIGEVGGGGNPRLPIPEVIPEPTSKTVELELLSTYPETMLPESLLPESKDVSLCEALDRILNKGAVLFGEVMISVADIDLVYLGLQVILSSMETARDLKLGGGAGGTESF